jgi:tryptophan synthase alpha chain
MNRITKLFAEKPQDILNIYFTAGYPHLEDTETLILALAEAGADLIELGMPYSDPLADGPTIQESGMQALQNGMTLHQLFDQIARVRQKTEVPLVMMGYFNQVMQYGEAAFFKKAASVGVDGLILPDLPLFEYEQFYQKMAAENGLTISFLITPQTTEARIRKVDELSSGFIYMVSSSSITGAKADITQTQRDYFERINHMALRNPRLIGFGISNHETFSEACQFANGAIIGSAFIKALKDSPDVRKTTLDFVKMVRSAEVEV